MASARALPDPPPYTSLQPIQALDKRSWKHMEAEFPGPISARRRRKSGSGVTPRLVFATLRMLLEQICTEERGAKRLYRCLRKKLEKFFDSDSTPNYDYTFLLTQELDRVISEIARSENIYIHFERSFVPDPSLGVLTKRSLSNPGIGTQCFSRNFQVIKLLGEGGFGRVYHARNMIDHGEYAVKEIPLRPEMSDSEENDGKSSRRASASASASASARNSSPSFASVWRQLTREVVILARLDHPNIVRYHTAWAEERLSLSPSPPVQSLEPWSAASSPSGQLVIEEAAASPPAPAPSLVLDRGRDLRSGDFHRPSADWPSDWSSESEPGPTANGDARASSSSSSSSAAESSTPVDIPGPARPRPAASPGDAASPPRKMVPFKPPRPLVGVAGDGCLLSSLVLYIQMQLCDTSLKEWLAKRNATEEGAIIDRKLNLNLFEQMTRGLEYLHSQAMIHRDIKPANILLVVHDDGSILVKLADFGLTTYVLGDHGDDERDADERLSSRIGTRFYAAPEQRAGGKYGQESDMYSLGLVLFELFQPYRTQSELVNLTEGLRRDPVDVDPDFQGRWPCVAECVRSLMHADPSRRPKATDVLLKSPMLQNWRLMKAENEELKQRVAFLESRLSARDQEVSDLLARLRVYEGGGSE